MIGLDTNVLVRFLVDDDEIQSARARRLIEKAISDEESLFVSDVVLCETFWVLASAYKVARKEIDAVFSELLQARALAFESRDRLADALAGFSRGRGDFADYIIGARAREAGCSTVATFDRALFREPGFTAVGP